MSDGTPAGTGPEPIEAMLRALIASFGHALPPDELAELHDLNDHREWGIALENLCVQLDEFDVEPTAVQLAQIQDAAEAMGLPPSTWDFLAPSPATSGANPDRALDELLAGFEARSLTPVGGGSTARAFRLETSTDRFFVKFHASPPPGLFDAEKCGLSHLTDAAPTMLGVPAIQAASDHGLVLDWIEEATTTPTAEQEFGAALAQLHATSGPDFGTLPLAVNYLGSVKVGAGHAPTWAEFYPRLRLRPLVEQAIGLGRLPDTARDLLRRLEPRFEDLAGPPEPPALLHGDLWAGNRLVDTGGRNWLIDPASFWGHREYDLAMMALFGGYGPEAWDAYDEASPLADGWRDRVRWLQLEPLLVHAILFGGSYSSDALSLLRSPLG